ncbi:hypothetical protein BCE02nite_05230 [Brevibacillus centrosporus]|nr:hypothetical protein BCE02nite_05230 [Brevibacillus centrosporus]
MEILDRLRYDRRRVYAFAKRELQHVRAYVPAPLSAAGYRRDRNLSMAVIVDQKRLGGSFNDPQGMCPECNGIGRKLVVDMSKALDMSKSLNEGAILLPDYKEDSEDGFRREGHEYYGGGRDRAQSGSDQPSGLDYR